MRQRISGQTTYVVCSENSEESVSGEDVTQMCQLLSLCQLTMKAEKKNIGFSFVTLLTMTFLKSYVETASTDGVMCKRMGEQKLGVPKCSQFFQGFLR